VASSGCVKRAAQGLVPIHTSEEHALSVFFTRRAWIRCCVSGHVSAVRNALRASRSRSADGNETWLMRFFAAAIGRRSSALWSV